MRVLRSLDWREVKVIGVPLRGVGGTTGRVGGPGVLVEFRVPAEDRAVLAGGLPGRGHGEQGTTATRGMAAVDEGGCPWVGALGGGEAFLRKGGRIFRVGAGGLRVGVAVTLPAGANAKG